MSRVTQTSAAMGLVETAHDGSGDLRSWCARLLEQAESLLGSAPLAVSVLRRRENDYDLLTMASNLPGFEQLGASLVPQAPLEFLDRFQQASRHVSTIRSILGDTLPVDQLEQLLRFSQAQDILGLVARADDTSLSVASLRSAQINLSSTERRLLTQVTLHLEAGLRLRQQPSSAVAVLHPDGRLLHAEGQLKRRAAREHLRLHVTGVERSRTRQKRRQEAAVGAWSALIAGAWGLVERTDSDGARHYAVLETRRSQHFRALSQLETSVVELSARGLTGKATAYGLGVNAVSVSRALSSATIKLGLRNRTQLLRMVAGLLGLGSPPSAAAEAELTGAERDVLHLLRLGWSNATIASNRGRSEHTVANQVAAILRKLEAPSRRALAVRGEP